jgi:hypothetical protein
MNPWNTAPAQGSPRRRDFFEGWYFKQVSRDRSETWSFIPGISRGRVPGDDSAFVQVIEGRTARTWWFEYPAEAFKVSTRRLDVRVGASRFSPEGIELDLSSPEASFSGKILFGAFSTLPFRPLAPGVMGPFGFVPFMECMHGLVSFDHGLEGSLVTAGGSLAAAGSLAAGTTVPDARVLDFSGGRGYAEKDWGVSMPSSWIWTQSNNFKESGDSFMLSIAKIPWLGSSFDGFLCAGRLGGRDLLEATWTGARVEGLRVLDDRVELTIASKRWLLELRVGRGRGGLLRAPVKGLLSRRIAESVDATLFLRLTEAGKLRFEGEAHNAGLEVVDAGALSRRPEPSRRSVFALPYPP